MGHLRDPAMLTIENFVKNAEKKIYGSYGATGRIRSYSAYKKKGEKMAGVLGLGLGTKY